MDKQKQIIITGPDSQGGITSVIKMHLENGLKDKVIFMPSYKGGTTLFKIFYFIGFLFNFACLLSTNKHIRLIHIHSSSHGSFIRKFFVTYLSKIFRKKVMFHIHGSRFEVYFNDANNFLKMIVRKTLEKADVVIVLSKEWKKRIISMCGQRNVKILYNPTFKKDIKEKKSKKVNVLFMGRVGHRKGVYDILKAAKLIQNSNVQINIYGDGEIDKVKNIVKENKISTKVKVNGWISGDDIEKAYNKSDIFILPSYNEGLPMSILEAISYGLPVISTNIDGIPEAVHDNINGYLIKPGDYKALAEKIDLLAHNAELRTEMGLQSLNISKNKFDIEVILNELDCIYTGVI